MAKELSKEDTIALGEWAKALSEDPRFVAVCNGMVAESLIDLMGTKPGSEEATKAHLRLLSAETFKQALTKLQNDATMAKRHSAPPTKLTQLQV